MTRWLRRERELGGEVMVDYSVSSSNGDTTGGTEESGGADETNCSLLGFSFLISKRRKKIIFTSLPVMRANELQNI